MAEDGGVVKRGSPSGDVDGVEFGAVKQQILTGGDRTTRHRLHQRTTTVGRFRSTIGHRPDREEGKSLLIRDDRLSGLAQPRDICIVPQIEVRKQARHQSRAVEQGQQRK